MKQLTVIGNIGRDATMNQTGTDIAINFSVASNTKYTTAAGVKMEKTSWTDCTIWRKQGDSTDIAQYLKAGTQVCVQGEPDVRAWLDKETGEPRAVQTLRVRSHELLSSKKEEAPAAQPKPGDLPASAFDNPEAGAAPPAATRPARRTAPAQ